MNCVIEYLIKLIRNANSRTVINKVSIRGDIVLIVNSDDHLVSCAYTTFIWAAKALDMTIMHAAQFPYVAHFMAANCRWCCVVIQFMAKCLSTVSKQSPQFFYLLSMGGFHSCTMPQCTCLDRVLKKRDLHFLLFVITLCTYVLSRKSGATILSA